MICESEGGYRGDCDEVMRMAAAEDCADQRQQRPAHGRVTHGVVWQSTLGQNRPGWSLDIEYNIGGAYGLETSVGRCTRRQAWVRQLEVDLMPSGGSLLTLVGARGHRS